MGTVDGIYVRHDFDQEMAYEMVKALYEHQQEFLAYHPTTRFWSIEANTAENLFHPFSLGTVKYFKEKGVWTAEKEAKQKQLLAEAGW